MKSKHCEWCDHQFETPISYKIYCSEECRNAATREKISLRYLQIKVKNRIGKNRKCKSCGEPLSIYNDDQTCNKCVINKTDVTKALKDMKRLADGKDK